jgi:hypothetical protein
MKHDLLFRSAVVLVAGLFLNGCETPGAPMKYGSEPVTSAPAAAGAATVAPVAGAFVGSISGGNYAKGVGFSNVNLYIEVTSDTGVVEGFFVRSDSKVFDAAGAPLNYLEPFRGKDKKVSIEYFTITDGTGGEPGRTDFAYEIGKKGVRTLRFFDWMPPK